MNNILKSKNGTTPRIAIQGYQGAFHEVATRFYQQTDDVEIIPADTFSEVVQLAENAELSDGALMAIENTIAGSLMSNYELLHQSNLKVVGEVYLRIKQNLLVLDGQRIEDLKEVYSHPIAIAQCHKFFSQYPHIKLIESIDTALSAKMVRDNNMKHAGAIAGKLAAEVYDMDVLAESIETNKENYTRFLVLAPRETIQISDTLFNKISLSFSIPHKIGSLHQVLAALAKTGANLTKIQSMPIIGKPWEYRFFVDYIIQQQANFQDTIDAIQPYIQELKVLGTYLEGNHYEE